MVSGDLLPDLKRMFGGEDDHIPRTLEKFVNGELEPEATARKIAMAYDESLRQGNDRNITSLWHTLVMASRYSGRERSNAIRMVALLNCLSEQGNIMQATTASTQSTSVGDTVFWRDLPGFAWDFRLQAFGAYITSIHVDFG